MMHGYDSWNGVSLASVRQLKGPRLLNAVVRDGVPTNAVVRDGVPASGCACAGMTTLRGQLDLGNSAFKIGLRISNFFVTVWP